MPYHPSIGQVREAVKELIQSGKLPANTPFLKDAHFPILSAHLKRKRHSKKLYGCWCKYLLAPEDPSLRRFGFFRSLDDIVPDERCHLEALPFRQRYPGWRTELTDRILKMLNGRVFNPPLQVTIIWHTQITRTAGITKKRNHADGSHYCEVSLSDKLLSTPARLRDVFIQELCNVDVYMNKHGDPYAPVRGTLWWQAVRRVQRSFSNQLPGITLKHCSLHANTSTH